MKNLFIAIKSKITGSTLDRLVGGRAFAGRAPQKTAYPYLVFFAVSDVQQDTFKNKMDDIIIQFSLFSSVSSPGEIEDIYDALETLFDDATMTITGATQCLLFRENTLRLSEEITTPTGTSEVWHTAVDYKIIIQRA